MLVACRHTDRVPDLVARLEPVYRPWFGPDCCVSVRQLPELRLQLAVIGDEPVELTDLGLWGEAVGTAGLATDEELLAPRQLMGSFVVVQALADRLRLTVGPDLVHALRHCSGPDGEAWSSHGLAGLLACGAIPAIARDRIPELVLLDYVLADDELLEGVRVLPEATRVEITPSDATEQDVWPVAERLLARSDVNVAELRAGVLLACERLAQVPRLHLALSAGRDSTMLASCFDELGVTLPSFTFGGLDTPDGAGAAAVADHLGWQHQCLAPAEAPGSLDRLLATTLWTEGLDTAWNGFGPPMGWPAQDGAVHLYGVGGELGRAYYWSDAQPEQLGDPVGLVTGWLQRQLSPEARSLLVERSGRFVHQLEAQGWTGVGVLDGWHARGRVRKWPMRTPLPSGVLASLTAYPSAPVAGLLLGMPAELRRGGVGFDAAAGGLRSVAQSAPFPHPRRRRFTRFRRNRSVTLARQARQELAVSDSPVLEVMGAGWWQDLERRIPYEPACHRWMWNSLAVEALAAVLAGLQPRRAFVAQ